MSKKSSTVGNCLLLIRDFEFDLFESLNNIEEERKQLNDDAADYFEVMDNLEADLKKALDAISNIKEVCQFKVK